ncbi:MAG: hypothetical protein MK042_07300 [Cognatishimia sp.]|nr:hypothetical protein [Cognatishimia sp.]
MTNEIEHQDIRATCDEKKAIYQHLLKRNNIRWQVGLPRLNIPKDYRRKVEHLEEQKFVDAIKPYLPEAYRRFPGSPGLPGRLKQHLDVLSYSAELAGIPAEQIRLNSFQEFLRLYTTKKLPLVPVPHPDSREPENVA